MKIQALVTAIALAFGASAFAQSGAAGTAGTTGNNTGGVPAASAGTGDTATTMPTHKTTKKSTKKHAKATKTKKKHVAVRHHRGERTAMMHQGRRDMHRDMHRDTHAMGAGPMSPDTNLQASERQARMDQAYANWQNKR